MTRIILAFNIPHHLYNIERLNLARFYFHIWVGRNENVCGTTSLGFVGWDNAPIIDINFPASGGFINYSPARTFRSFLRSFVQCDMSYYRGSPK